MSPRDRPQSRAWDGHPETLAQTWREMYEVVVAILAKTSAGERALALDDALRAYHFDPEQI